MNFLGGRRQLRGRRLDALQRKVFVAKKKCDFWPVQANVLNLEEVIAPF